MTTFAPPLVQLSARRFAQAVAALVEDRVDWVDGRCVTSESLYGRLRGALTAKTVSAGGGVACSRAPLRIDVLALLAEVDSTTAGWGANGVDTVERLRELASRQGTPEQTEALDAQAGLVEKWTVVAAELLRDTPPVVPLRVPCPSCGELWAYRQAGGERVRSYALRASEAGASCAACRAVWPVEQFDWLATLLRSK